MLMIWRRPLVLISVVCSLLKVAREKIQNRGESMCGDVGFLHRMFCAGISHQVKLFSKLCSSDMIKVLWVNRTLSSAMPCIRVMGLQDSPDEQ